MNASLVYCPACKRQIAQTALQCPHCGFRTKYRCGCCDHYRSDDDYGHDVPFCVLTKEDISDTTPSCISWKAYVDLD